MACRITPRIATIEGGGLVSSHFDLFGLLHDGHYCHVCLTVTIGRFGHIMLAEDMFGIPELRNELLSSGSMDDGSNDGEKCRPSICHKVEQAQCKVAAYGVSLVASPQMTY